MKIIPSLLLSLALVSNAQAISPEHKEIKDKTFAFCAEMEKEMFRPYPFQEFCERYKVKPFFDKPDIAGSIYNEYDFLCTVRHKAAAFVNDLGMGTRYPIPECKR